MKRYAISPIDTYKFVKGKKYPLTYFKSYGFTINSRHFKANIDEESAFCLKKGCAHIKGNDWEIVEKN